MPGAVTKLLNYSKLIIWKETGQTETSQLFGCFAPMGFVHFKIRKNFAKYHLDFSDLIDHVRDWWSIRKSIDWIMLKINREINYDTGAVQNG